MAEDKYAQEIKMNQLQRIKQIFKDLGYSWVEPQQTTEGAIVRKEAGMHRGVYYIYPEKNFYFGKAQSKKKNGRIYDRHLTHWAKLQVDLSALYGPKKIKRQPKWTFPMGFREGVATFLLDGCESIPSHWTLAKDQSGNLIRNDNGKSMVMPGVIEFPVTHKVDVDSLPVLIWNLDHLDEEDIKRIEHRVIHTIWPYCNTETYHRRHEKQG